jgi:PAS domain S-box-containing protein
VVVVFTPASRPGSAPQLGLLQALLASLPAAVAYLAGPELMVEFANDAARKLIGYRDVLGRPLRETVPEIAEQGVFGTLERVLRTGEPATGTEAEVRIRRHLRTERRFVDYVQHPVRDASGAVAGVLLYATDVTTHVRDRRRLEALTAQLAASEERYRTLFETMPQGVMHYGADGSVIDVNAAAAEILGLTREQMTSWPIMTAQPPIHPDGTPYQTGDLPIPAALRTGQIVPDTMVGISHGKTGELRWLRMTAVPDTRDRSGRPQRAYGVFTDVTEQLRTEAALHESTILLSRLRDANVLGMALHGEDGIHEASDAFLDIVGYSQADVTAGRLSYAMLTPPEWVDADRAALAELKRTGACQPYDKEYRHRDGHRVPVMVGGAVVDWQPFRWVTFIIDLTARQRAEHERAGLLLRERAARDEAAQAQERLTFLLSAGALAAATRDRRELLDQATRLVVPSLGDYCLVFLPTGDGMLLASAVHHHDPAQAALLRVLRELPVPATGPLIVQQAYRTGRTVLVPDVSTEMPKWTAAEPGFTAILRQVEPHSTICAPLTAGHNRLGVMIVTRSRGRPRFTARDAEMAEELARRLATGLANADTFAREHRIAETLQRSLLPDSLPTVPGLDLAVRYLPATAGADVGGDWYDAFPAGGSRVALVIGDVVGHSITSASVMGQVRNVLRAYVIDEPSPAEVLRRTSLALGHLLPEAMATVCCAVLDVATGDLDYANAGHPPPLVTGPDGISWLDDTDGIMLGVTACGGYQTGHRRLPPGSALLFYTDGLVEDRERDIGEGFAALASALQGAAGLPAAQVCTTAQDAMLGSRPRADDICLLAARRQG